MTRNDYVPHYIIQIVFSRLRDRSLTASHHRLFFLVKETIYGRIRIKTGMVASRVLYEMEDEMEEDGHD